MCCGPPSYFNENRLRALFSGNCIRKGVFKINLAPAKIIQLKVPNTQLLNGFDEPSKTVIFIAKNKIKVVHQAYLCILTENIPLISDILVGNLDPLFVITDSSVYCMCVN